MSTVDPGQLNFQIVAQDYTPPFDSTSDSGGTWLITFRTKPSGVEGQVTVPAAAYGPQQVAELIYPQAAAIEAVHGLGRDE